MTFFSCLFSFFLSSTAWLGDGGLEVIGVKIVGWNKNAEAVSGGNQPPPLSALLLHSFLMPNEINLKLQFLRRQARGVIDTTSWCVLNYASGNKLQPITRCQELRLDKRQRQKNKHFFAS